MTPILFCCIANFQLPEVGPFFDKVNFVELDREEAQKLVEKYNKEGKAALPPPEKRFRGGHNDDRHGAGRYGPGFGGNCLKTNLLNLKTLCRMIKNMLQMT